MEAMSKRAALFPYFPEGMGMDFFVRPSGFAFGRRAQIFVVHMVQI